jgi:hypothetical protein
VKQAAEFFGERPMVLIYIAKKLRDALALEELLTAAGLDYAVEVDTYSGGLIFRTERTGAFFYVEEPQHERALSVMVEAGYKPVAVELQSET